MFDDWPAPARAMARSLTSAIVAAQQGDLTAFEEACADLRKIEPAPLNVVLGAVAQDLLERVAPDGLDSETAELVLDRCLAEARPWFASVDQSQLIRAFTDVVGVSETDGESRPADTDVQAHGLLLIADLTAAAKARPTTVIEAALRELQREQTIEMP